MLHKPFTPKVLSDTLARLLSPGDGEASTPEAPAVDAPFADLAVIDPKTFEELRRFASSGRQDFVTRIVGLYLDHAPKAARDIADRAGEGQCDLVAKSAHALKSMSLNIGARRVAALASEIEACAKAQSAKEPAVLTQLDLLRGEACGFLKSMVDGPPKVADTA